MIFPISVKQILKHMFCFLPFLQPLGCAICPSAVVRSSVTYTSSIRKSQEKKFIVMEFGDPENLLIQSVHSVYELQMFKVAETWFLYGILASHSCFKIRICRSLSGCGLNPSFLHPYIHTYIVWIHKCVKDSRMWNKP
jgi:hypothetical protein